MVTDSSYVVKSFLQSAEWEALQGRLGRKTWRIDGKLVIRHDLPFGINYLYVPRPSFKDGGEFKKFSSLAGDIAKKENSAFLKIEPEDAPGFPYQGLKTSHNLQPTKTIIIDLSKSEEMFLAKMHPKTRYNIRLSEKHGVKIGKETGEDSFRDFFSLLRQTARRERFHAHAENHYRSLIETRSGAFWNELYLARYNGKVLAAALVNFYRASGRATYLHGASSREYKEVMAPYLLHWEIIRDAKSRGFDAYDFWGIDEKRWPGVTRFKLGFGGNITEYPPAADFVYSPARYALYRIVRAVKH